ncbi:MAG: carbohydrate kinase family protein [Hyphomicrobiales bacterium]|nr:carbohydrate kinase family protein [Hyphomicrobiales bacterium]
MARFDAVFVGLTILDVAGRPVEGIPEGGNIGFIEQIRLNPAGTAAGAVMNAAKLGISTAAVACLGNDEKGDFVLDVYRRMGIDCSMVQRTDAAETSATILLIRPDGERPALHCRGASDHLFVNDDAFNAVCDTRFLHHGGAGLLDAMDKGQSARLLAHAKQKNLTTTLDLIAPNEGTMDQLRALLPHVDYFMPSMEEAAFMSGQDDPIEIANVFHAAGAGVCIFKWGMRGSFISTSDRTFRVPAYSVTVSDTTGCGDSYCGGFVTGLAMDWSLEDACRLGTATSALVATGLGSEAGVVDLETTCAFIRTASPID